MAGTQATTVATAQVMLVLDSSKFKTQLTQALQNSQTAATTAAPVIAPRISTKHTNPMWEELNKRGTATIITMGRLFRTLHHAAMMGYVTGIGGAMLTIRDFLKSGATDARMFNDRISEVRSNLARVGGMVL
jgi:S-adenosylmethionine:diacylglycerol 3-amino-3-carboxypropyl transferase